MRLISAGVEWIGARFRKAADSFAESEQDRDTAAYQQGFEAHAEGDDFNPYPSNTANHRRWIRGYEDYENFRAQGW